MAMDVPGLRYSFALLVRFFILVSICPIATGQIFIVNMTRRQKECIELRAKTIVK